MRHETDKLFAPGTAAGISRRRDLWLSSRGFKIVGMLIYHSQRATSKFYVNPSGSQYSSSSLCNCIDRIIASSRALRMSRVMPFCPLHCILPDAVHSINKSSNIYRPIYLVTA